MKRFPKFLFAALVSGIIAGSISYFNSKIPARQDFFPSDVEHILQTEIADQEPQSLLLSLKNPWLFSIGDQSEWSQASFDDRAWQEINTGEPWESQGYAEYDGYAWYRKHMIVPSLTEPSSLTLLMGHIDDADELFFNGKLIGKTGAMPPNYSTGYQAERRYQIPAAIINWGRENVIAIRVYDGGLDGGIREGELGLYTVAPRPTPEIDLSGSWEFVLEPELNELGEKAEWKNINVPGVWETQGYPDYDGFAWYRKTVTVPPTFSGKSFVLVLGKIDDMDEVYIDGKKIASTGSMEKGNIRMTGKEWKAFRGYYIPDGVVKKGKPHEIAIRVYDDHGQGGIYEGPIGLISQKKYIDFWKKHRKRLE